MFASNILRKGALQVNSSEQYRALQLVIWQFLDWDRLIPPSLERPPPIYRYVYLFLEHTLLEYIAPIDHSTWITPIV